MNHCSDSMVRKIRKNLHEMSLELSSFRNGSYPDFIRSASPEPLTKEIPVFMLHSINPSIFEAQLLFLAKNGYQTISCDMFYEMIIGKIPVSERTILLTIDDGKSSVWAYAYPLLKKYGFTATVFLIPGYMKESDEYLFNLEDYWQGKCELNALRDRDTNFFPLLTWEETREMHESGVLDFQCHTLYHHKIYTGDTIVDFFNPDPPEVNFNLMLPQNYEEKVEDNNIHEFYGMPIYENNSLLAARTRYLNDTRLTDLCIEHVSGNGGVRYFKKPAWRKDLFAVVKNFKKENNGDPHRVQSPEPTRREIFEKLSKARNIIEAKVPGKLVRHLCFPYGIGSDEAVEQSKKAGYVTNFWTTIHGKSINRPNDNPFYCCRLKDDYLFRLPGQDRKSLRGIILQKLKRRLSGESLY